MWRMQRGFVVLASIARRTLIGFIGTIPSSRQDIGGHCFKTTYGANVQAMSEFPETFRLRQQFDGPQVEDIEATVDAQLAGLALQKKIQPGQSVAITAGSRGIANIARIITAAVDHLKRLGGQAADRTGHGKSRRSHGRRPTAADRIVRNHRAELRLSDSVEHGDCGDRSGTARIRCPI